MSTKYGYQSLTYAAPVSKSYPVNGPGRRAT